LRASVVGNLVLTALLPNVTHSLWSCWWWQGMSLSDEMKQKSPSKLSFCYFPRFQSPSPTSLLLPKIIASLCYSVSTLPGAGCSYHSVLPISPLSKYFSGDAACRHLSLCLSLSVSLSVPLEERHLLHYFFFPQTIHVGGLENKTEGVGGPRWIQRLISHMAAELHKYICSKKTIPNTLNILSAFFLLLLLFFLCFLSFTHFSQPNQAHCAGWTHKHHFVYRFPALTVAWLTSAVMWYHRSRWITWHGM